MSYKKLNPEKNVKKMNIEMKNNLIKFLDGHEIHPNVIRSNYKGKINDILYYDKGIWWVQDLSSYLHIELSLIHI